MKEGGQSDAEHERFSIQRTASKEISGSVYWSIYHQQGSIYQYS